MTTTRGHYEYQVTSTIGGKPAGSLGIYRSKTYAHAVADAARRHTPVRVKRIHVASDGHIA